MWIASRLTSIGLSFSSACTLIFHRRCDAEFAKSPVLPGEPIIGSGKTDLGVIGDPQNEFLLSEKDSDGDKTRLLDVLAVLGLMSSFFSSSSSISIMSNLSFDILISPSNAANTFSTAKKEETF